MGTTPTHTFIVPFDTSNIKALEIIYAQAGEKVFEKDIEDCKMSGNEISVTLTQEETFKFSAVMNVEIQIRLMDDNGAVFASDIMRVSCKKCLSSEVIR